MIESFACEACEGQFQVEYQEDEDHDLMPMHCVFCGEFLLQEDVIRGRSLDAGESMDV